MSSNYKIIIKLSIFPVLVYIFNTTFQSLASDFYITYSIDTLAHFLGGLSIAYSASYALFLMEREKWIKIQKDILKAAIVIGSVMSFAVLWEFYEFIYDLFLWGDTMQPSVADTIKDLCVGMIGAVVFSYLFVYLKIDKRTN